MSRFPTPGEGAPCLCLADRVDSWILEPAGMLNVVRPGVILDKDVACFISVTVDREMKRRGAEKYVYIHDFSQSSGYTTAARNILTRWGIVSRKSVAEVLIAFPKQNPFYEMGIAVAIAVLKTAGVQMQIVESAAAALQTSETRPRASCGSAPATPKRI